MEILEVLFERFPNMSRHAANAARGLHGVERRSEGDGEIVQVALKIAITGEAEPTNDTHDRGGISPKTFRHRADTKKNVVARMLENRTNNLLALGAEKFY